MTDRSFPIIGIGASAGGIDAFHSFFNSMPADCGMAFVILLHLPADRKSMLSEILGRWTSMRVLDGTDGALIEPNCVYVPPPHSVVTLLDGRLGFRAQRRPTIGCFDRSMVFLTPWDLLCMNEPWGSYCPGPEAMAHWD
jgi:chemotaxis response regulator CheB